MFKAIWKTIVNAIKVVKSFITGNICNNMSSSYQYPEKNKIIVTKGDKLKLLPWLLGLYRCDDFDSSYAYGKTLKRKLPFDLISIAATMVIWMGGNVYNVPYSLSIAMTYHFANVGRLMVRNMKLAQAALDA